MNAQELIFRICAREAVSLLRLLDRTPKELVRTAANYGCSLEEFPAWVNQRVREQLQKAASISSKSGPFTPVIVAEHYVESISLAWPTGNVHSMVEPPRDTHRQALLQHPTYQTLLAPNSEQANTPPLSVEPNSAQPDGTHKVADVEAFYGVGKVEDRLAMCGTFQWRRTASSKPKPFQIRCKVFRRCDDCAAERAKDYREELKYAAVVFDQGDAIKLNLVKVMVADANVAKPLRRAHKKPVYRCLPQEDGTTVFYFSESGYQADKFDLEVKLVNYDDLDSEDWIKLTRTPEGRRISGALGVQAKKVKTGANVTLVGLTITPPKNMTVEKVTTLAQDVADTVAKRPPMELTPEVWASWLEAQQVAFEAALKDLGAKVSNGFEYKVWFCDLPMSFNVLWNKNALPIKRRDDDLGDIKVPF